MRRLGRDVFTGVAGGGAGKRFGLLFPPIGKACKALVFLHFL